MHNPLNKTVERAITTLQHTDSIQTVEQGYQIINTLEALTGAVVKGLIVKFFGGNDSKGIKEIAKHTAKTEQALKHSIQSYNKYIKVKNELIYQAKYFGLSADTKLDVETKLNSLSESAISKLPSDPKEAITKLEELSTDTKITAVMIKGKPRAFTSLVRSKVYLASGGHCNNCTKFITLDDYECDHIVPYSKGGLTTLDNAQALCRNCNRIKSNKEI